MSCQDSAHHAKACKGHVPYPLLFLLRCIDKLEEVKMQWFLTESLHRHRPLSFVMPSVHWPFSHSWFDQRVAKSHSLHTYFWALPSVVLVLIVTILPNSSPFRGMKKRTTLDILYKHSLNCGKSNKFKRIRFLAHHKYYRHSFDVECTCLKP